MQNVDHNIGFWEKRQFFRRKLSKIAEDCDHNIDPRSLGKTCNCNFLSAVYKCTMCLSNGSRNFHFYGGPINLCFCSRYVRKSEWGDDNEKEGYYIILSKSEMPKPKMLNDKISKFKMPKFKMSKSKMSTSKCGHLRWAPEPPAGGCQ
jgi:hypothetical protein